METYTVKFLTPGQFIIHKDRRFRTPVTFECMSKKDIKFFDIQARTAMVKYTVEKTKDVQEESFVEELALQKEEMIETEELIEPTEAVTILEKLLETNEK